MRTRIIFLFLLSLGLTLSSCKKDDDGDDGGNNNPVPGQGTMTLKVDGTAWSASLAVVASNSGGVLAVTGSDSQAKQCGISMMNVNGPGTYELGGSLTNPNMGRWTAGLNTEDTYTTSVGLGSGTCTITSLTATHVEGTFEFTAKNTAQLEVVITEGSFSADIQ
jgi:hypothetical protein